MNANHRSSATRGYGGRVVICIAIVCVWMALFSQPAAAVVTCEYTGNHFNNFSCGSGGDTCPIPNPATSSYTTNDFVKATLTFDSPLPSNSHLLPVTGYPGFTLSLTDGHQTLTAPTVQQAFIEVLISTDSVGQIIAPWRIAIVRTTGGGTNSTYPNILTMNDPDRQIGDSATLSYNPDNFAVVYPGSPGTWGGGQIGGEPAVGRATQVSGAVTVIRSDGSRETVGVGTQFRLGDVIETGPTGSVSINFADDTTFAVAESTRITVEQLTYDPDAARSPALKWLQGIFVYVSGLIGAQDKGEIQLETPVGALGIRGDATQYINKDFLDVAVKMNVGSPVSLVAPVPAAHGPVELSFEYVFLTPTGKLEVFLDDALLYSVLASEHPVKEFQRAAINVAASSSGPFVPVVVSNGSTEPFSNTLVLAPSASVGADTAKLTFRLDGLTGSSLLIDNIVFPGLQNGDFSQFDNGWFQVGPGRLDLVATISEVRLAELLRQVGNASPICSAAQAFPSSLWSPNHQFVPIVVMGVTDPEGDAVTITVTNVTQDEPVTTPGSGNTSPDAVIEAGSASVRAERLGSGNGRVYQISFRADDGKGGSCTGAAKVGVPHSQKKGLTAIDDGQTYNSTIP